MFVKWKKLKYTKSYELLNYIGSKGQSAIFYSLIFKGRKLWAFNKLLDLKLLLKHQEEIDPFITLTTSIMKIMPEVILFPRKLGGRIQGVPLPITERKQYTYVISATIRALRSKMRIIILMHLVELLTSAIYEKGEAYEKKLIIYKTSSDNRHLLRFFRK